MQKEFSAAWGFALVGAAGAGWALAWAAGTFPLDALADTAWFLAAALVLARVNIQTDYGTFYPASVPIVGAALGVLPPQGVVVLAAAVAVALSLRLRRPRLRILFNTANWTLSGLAASLLYRQVHPGWRAPLAGPVALLALLLALLVQYLINVLAIALLRRLEGQRTGWWAAVTSEGLAAFSLRLFAVVLAAGYPTAGPWLLAPAVLFLFAITDAVQFYFRRDLLIRSARTDGLTGVRNRLAWEQRKRELEASPPGPVVLVLVDLDGLKGLNDTAGHLEGDQAIRDLAGALVTAAGSVDRVFRLGGDEFLVLLPGEAPDGEAVRRVRAALADFRQRWQPAGHGVRVAASAGFAAVPADGTSISDLLRLADERMYQAKREPRAELPPEG